MYKKTYQLALGAVAALLSSLAIAHSGAKANAGYVSDANGHIAMDGRGQCMHTSAWTKDLAIAECEPNMMPKKAEVTPEVKPAPVAAAPVVVPKAKADPVFEDVSLKAGALFDSSKAVLKPAGLEELDQLVTKLKTYPEIEMIKVTGHTDSQGALTFNKTLSEQRAAAVKAYLVKNGIEAGIINTAGMGESKPKASNDTAEGRAQNRRVQLEISAQQQVTR